MKTPWIAAACTLVAADLASAVGLRVVSRWIDNYVGQEVEILTTGSGRIPGVNLYIQVGDGGEFVGGSDVPGIDAAPITDIRFDGGIWGPVKPEAVQVEIYSGLVAHASFLAPAPGVTLTAPGKIATLILDGVGLSPATAFSIQLEIPLAGVRSDFVGVPADELIGGVIYYGAPPEPASALLMVLGLPMIARRCKR